MIELLRLFTDIALMRKSPEDLPASPLVLVLTIVGFFGVQLVVGTVLPPVAGHWINNLVLEVVFTFFWYTALLYAVRKPERFLQTSTAVFGFQIVLAPVLIAALWLQRRFEPDSIGAFGVTLISLALLIWVIAANSHIVKSALEWSMAPSVALVILQNLAGELLVLTFFHS